MECILCNDEINPILPRIRGGGKLALCGTCTKKLEENGFLKLHEDGIELRKPLLDIIISYSSL